MIRVLPSWASGYRFDPECLFFLAEKGIKVKLLSESKIVAVVAYKTSDALKRTDVNGTKNCKVL